MKSKSEEEAKRRHVTTVNSTLLHNLCIELSNIYALIEDVSPMGHCTVGDWWELSCPWGLFLLALQRFLNNDKAKNNKTKQKKQNSVYTAWSKRKCWQHVVNRRTKCRPRCIDKNKKTTDIVTELNSWGRHGGHGLNMEDLFCQIHFEKAVFFCTWVKILDVKIFISS